jgi:hypothetical protein
VYDEKWVNAFYVRKFPFFIAADDLTSRKDNGEHIIYTSSGIVKIISAKAKNGRNYLNMYAYNLEDGSYSYDKEARTDEIREVYNFYGKRVRLLDNKFNHVIELYHDIIEKCRTITPAVAWLWHHYEALEYDLSGILLHYGITSGKSIGYATGILGDFYFWDHEENYWSSPMVYLQRWPGNDEHVEDFKIKFFVENNEILKIIYEYPIIK